MNSTAELVAEVRHLSERLNGALNELQRLSVELANRERDYRLERAKAWLECPEDTVKATETWVNGKTADARWKRDMAEHKRQTALEGVRNFRQQISAAQSIANVLKAEAEIGTYQPQESP